jgi:hypothetical protein
VKSPIAPAIVIKEQTEKKSTKKLHQHLTPAEIRKEAAITAIK